MKKLVIIAVSMIVGSMHAGDWHQKIAKALPPEEAEPPKKDADTKVKFAKKNFPSSLHQLKHLLKLLDKKLFGTYQEEDFNNLLAQAPNTTIHWLGTEASTSWAKKFLTFVENILDDEQLTKKQQEALEKLKNAAARAPQKLLTQRNSESK